jgi:hypothetical protein
MSETSKSKNAIEETEDIKSNQEQKEDSKIEEKHSTIPKQTSINTS